MLNGNRVKPKISTEYKDSDGEQGTRSLMSDFQTLRARIFIRVQKAIGDKESNRIVLPGINAYNTAEYDKALVYFNESIKQHPEITEELRPHIIICNRVLSTALTIEDINYRETFTKWERIPRLLKYFRRTPDFKIRCKYCGHYTYYYHPEQGLAYLGTNNCQICGRGYPSPDFAWDGIDGQAYIYYRHSVTEAEFYKEFEKEYNVFPDHNYFLKKK